MPLKSSRQEAKNQQFADRRQRSAQVKTRWLDDKTSLLLVGGIFVIHCLGLASLFAPLSGLFNNQPVIEQDWGLHFHHLKSMAAFWHQDRNIWGYNPLFVAGYPSNTIQDLSIKFFEFAGLGLATFGLAPIQWFKLLAFLAMAGIPWFMYFAARNLFFDRSDIKNGAALMAALLGTAYWWNSLPREMFFYGMIGYPPAAYTSVLGATLLYRIAKHASLWSATHFGWLIIAVIILPLHVQSIVIFLPPIVALLLVQEQISRRNLLIWIAGAGALSTLANLPWLAIAFAHRTDDVSAAIVDQLPLFTSVDPLTFIKDYLGPSGYWSFRPSFWEKGFRLMLLALGCWGTAKLLRSENRAAGIVLASAGMVLFLIAYFGALIPFVKSWQPLRFKIPFDLFLTLAAAYILAQGINGRSLTRRSYAVPIIAAFGFLAFLFNLLATETRGKMLLRTQLRPELNAIVAWIKHETPPAGRVLFEESGDETGFVYDGMYLSAFIPHWTGRELIGGPINLYNDRHHFAEFHSGKLLKKDIRTLSDEAIRNYFRLYNIGAVVAFDPASIQRLRSVPGLVTVDQRIGPVHMMKVNQPLTWFVKGDGKVDAGLNQIAVSNVRGGEVILKYHWVAGLRSRPELKIAPVQIGDDPIPFIKVIDPPAAFELHIPR